MERERARKEREREREREREVLSVWGQFAGGDHSYRATPWSPVCGVAVRNESERVAV